MNVIVTLNGDAMAVNRLLLALADHFQNWDAVVEAVADAKPPEMGRAACLIIDVPQESKTK